MHSHHSHEPPHRSSAPGGAASHSATWRTSLSATLHCLTGCSIGEILGMVLGTTNGWGNAVTIPVSVALAFLFGYALTLLPLVRSGLKLRNALGLAFASDTVSIALMEFVDNGIMLTIPGAMDAGPASLHFWRSMGLSLLIAGLLAWPLNHWMISRGLGHAKVHAHH